jgi:hypothetical protein
MQTIKLFMKKITAIFFLLIAIVTTAQEQQKLKQNLLLQADEMGKAFIAKDYAAFASFTHPDLLKKFGGTQKMADIIRYSFSQIENVKFIDVTFAQPSEIINVEGELQCTVPQMIEMEADGQQVTANTTIIAISRDNGKTWSFTDTAGQNIQALQATIPNLSPQLNIPEMQEPVFEEAPEKNR